MTAREMLREVADALDPGVPRPAYDGEGNEQRAAALRALADRWDHEERDLIDRRDLDDTRQGLAVLARLDAPADPVLQKEPR